MNPARIAVAFSLVVAVMILHEAEHVAQVVQKDVVGSACPRDCRGLLGFAFDIEWVHFAYNTLIFVALAAIYAAGGLWRREWRERAPVAWSFLTTGLFLVQGYHVVEHAVKLEQWLENGHRSPTPGLLGQPLAPASDMSAFSLVELHFVFNTVVFVAVIVGWIALDLHRPVRRVHVAGLAGAVAAMGVIAWVAQPPTIRLAAGIHDALVLDESVKVIGEPGAVVRGGITITASDVTVRDLTVVGGEHAIEVDGARNVLLDRVTVRGPFLDGINVRRATVIVRDCRIDGGRGEYTQGIDISYGFDLGGSLVSGCDVRGTREGIVSHFARVQVRKNVVRDTTLRGIAVTEMSMGAIEENDVADALGVGIFCGDYSHCSISGNRVARTPPDRSVDDRSRLGYGIQAHYGAVAKLGENTLAASPGGIGAFAGARIERS